MSAEYLYYLLVFALAMTAAPFNRVAVVVLVVWMLGQFAWLAGLPMAWAYIAIHMVAFSVACVVARNPICAIVAALYVPMIAVDIAELALWMSPENGWWLRVYLGTAQLFLLWPAVKFDALLRAYNGHRERSGSRSERVVA